MKHLKPLNVADPTDDPLREYDLYGMNLPNKCDRFGLIGPWGCEGLAFLPPIHFCVHPNMATVEADTTLKCSDPCPSNIQSNLPCVACNGSAGIDPCDDGSCGHFFVGKKHALSTRHECKSICCP